MPRAKRPLVTHIFKGGRFADHGIDIDALQELLKYKSLLVESAKELWRRHNPDRTNLPKNYEDSLVLKFYRIEPGSVAVPIEREYEVSEETLDFGWPKDELDEAVVLVADTVIAASEDRPLPESFPKKLLERVADYGRTLRDDEWIEQTFEGRRTPARYDVKGRRRLLEWSAQGYEDVIDLIGTVTMARVNRPRMGVTLDDGREVDASFNRVDEATITTALKEHESAKLRVEGRGRFSADGQLERIIHVDRLTLLHDGQIPYQEGARAIWEEFDDIASALPEEMLCRLPTDGAEQHDHYIHGTPKRHT